MESAASLLLIGFLVATATGYLLLAHCLSVIARKTGHGDLMQVLAWLPLLQLVPTLRVGGVTLLRFLLHMAGLVLAAGAIFAVSGLLEGGWRDALRIVGSVLLGLLATLYVGWIQWRTAQARELPGWLGLLTGVPVVGLAIYPIMAFHDGWVWPHKVGGALGALLTIALLAPGVAQLGSLPPIDGPGSPLAMLSATAESEDASASATMEREWEATPGTPPRDDEPTLAASSPASATPVAGAVPSPEQSVRVLFELQGRFASLTALAEPGNMRDPDHRSRALRLIHSIRADLEGHRADLDAETHQQLAGDLDRIEARILGRAAPKSSGSLRVARRPRTTAGNGAAAPAAPTSTASHDAAPVEPFAVNASEDCPPGAELRERVSDQGEEEWCQQLEQLGGLRHGWYARYFENGRPEQVGEYRDGLRVGVWTRFHPSGEVRAQAEFEAGLQHGWLLSFDEQGQRLQAVRFERGVARR